MPVTVTVRNSASCRPLSLGILSYYFLIHQTINKFFMIIDNECVLDEAKAVFLHVIHMNVSIQTVNKGIKRNQKKSC
jgi:hypothetical protein